MRRHLGTPSSSHRCLAAAILLAAITLHGCAMCPCATTRAPAPPITHIVFITLVDSSETAALLADADAALPAIDGVATYQSGIHLDVGIETVLADYDAAFIMGFESPADLQTYLAHPDHVAMVNRWRDRIAEIAVRDVVSE